MIILFVTILLIGYFLITTERYTNINKAAVAIFVGTLGWIVYICYGTDFVMEHHQGEYLNFLNGEVPTSVNVKYFISQHIFIKYVGKASEIALFLLSTMTIVEILQNNGCFDFISQLLRTRSSKKMLWVLSLITFLISANLDNLTTTVMMLTIMHRVVVKQRQRMLFGCAIVISANCGGALTVIGAPTGLAIWNMGAVSATNYSMSVAIPCLIAWLLPIAWIGTLMPRHVEIDNVSLPYRGDDTNLNVWQRLLMLFVGIGGLWFIPTFHNLTKLSPFVGALCVVGILWIVNEIMNRRLLGTDEMIHRRIPRVLQYGVIQMILFVIGIMLTVGVVYEMGICDSLSKFFSIYMSDLWSIGMLTQILSSILDNFATAITMISMHGGAFAENLVETMDGSSCGDSFWKIISYASSVGGNILCVGSMSGLALMKMERVHFVWYMRNVGCVALLASTIGLTLMYIIL